MWLLSKSWKMEQARILLLGYKGGCGVCAATCRLIAVVTPDGNVRDLKRPFKKYELWQMQNKPAPNECPCANYYDPEVQGPYRDKGLRDHHPFCQFEQTAGVVFVDAQGHAAQRAGLKFEYGMPVIEANPEAKNSNAAGQGKALVKDSPFQVRPDEWEKLRQGYKGR